MSLKMIILGRRKVKNKVKENVKEWIVWSKGRLLIFLKSTEENDWPFRPFVHTHTHSHAKGPWSSFYGKMRNCCQACVWLARCCAHGRRLTGLLFESVPSAAGLRPWHASFGLFCWELHVKGIAASWTFSSKSFNVLGENPQYNIFLFSLVLFLFQFSAIFFSSWKISWETT